MLQLADFPRIIGISFQKKHYREATRIDAPLLSTSDLFDPTKVFAASLSSHRFSGCSFDIAARFQQRTSGGGHRYGRACIARRFLQIQGRRKLFVREVITRLVRSAAQ